MTKLISGLKGFRQDKYALMAEIKQVCHEVKVLIYDKDAWRFLWRINSSDILEKYLILVVVFGKVDSSCCTYDLCVRFLKKKADVALKDIINHSFCVDDFLKFCSNEETVKILFYL